MIEYMYDTANSCSQTRTHVLIKCRTRYAWAVEHRRTRDECTRYRKPGGWWSMTGTAWHNRGLGNAAKLPRHRARPRETRADAAAARRRAARTRIALSKLLLLAFLKVAGRPRAVNVADEIRATRPAWVSLHARSANTSTQPTTEIPGAAGPGPTPSCQLRMSPQCSTVSSCPWKYCPWK